MASLALRRGREGNNLLPLKSARWRAPEEREEALSSLLTDLAGDDKSSREVASFLSEKEKKNNKNLMQSVQVVP